MERISRRTSGGSLSKLLSQACFSASRVGIDSFEDASLGAGKMGTKSEVAVGKPMSPRNICFMTKKKSEILIAALSANGS